MNIKDELFGVNFAYRYSEVWRILLEINKTHFQVETTIASSKFRKSGS